MFCKLFLVDVSVVLILCAVRKFSLVQPFGIRADQVVPHLTVTQNRTVRWRLTVFKIFCSFGVEISTSVPSYLGASRKAEARARKILFLTKRFTGMRKRWRKILCRNIKTVPFWADVRENAQYYSSSLSLKIPRAHLRGKKSFEEPQKRNEKKVGSNQTINLQDF